MRNFNIEFQFTPVGQGLFYTGIFEHLPSASRFTVVYDCGTVSVERYIKNEIDVFQRNIKKEDKLDLLIISHFHVDHISHIPDLLFQTNGAKLVVVPFLSPDELILSYYESLNRGGNPFPPAFFANPAKYLMDEYKVDKVIYIHPLEDKEDSLSEGEGSISFTEDFEFILDNRLQSRTDITSEVGITHCFDFGSLSLSDLWEFKFFNKLRDPAQLVAFKKGLSILLKNTTPTIDDVTKYINTQPSTGLHNFKKLYDESFLKNHINDTSLVVFHSALILIPFENIRSWITGRPGFPPRRNAKGNSSNRYGNLLVGDIKVDKKCLDQITAKWSSSIRNKVFYGQIPHHGAARSLIPKYFSAFPNAIRHIINYGLGNGNKHPKQVIIDMVEVSRANNRIYSNTQLNKISIKYVIEK
jgi:ribonuclease BN (tRNA processing enzyme)